MSKRLSHSKKAQNPQATATGATGGGSQPATTAAAGKKQSSKEQELHHTKEEASAQLSHRLNCPLFSLSLSTRTKGRSVKEEELFLCVGGGGGPGRTGVGNVLAFYKVDGGGALLPWFQHDMGEEAVYHLQLHPKEACLLCGVGTSACRVYSFDKNNGGNVELQNEFQTDFAKSDSEQKIVIFNREGDRAATAGTDGVIRVWQWPSCKQVKLKHTMDAYSTSGAAVTALDYSPDGTMLASISSEGDAMLRVWNATTGQCVQETLPPGHNKGLRFRGCLFSPDENHMFTAQTKGRSDSFITKWRRQKDSWIPCKTSLAHKRLKGACTALAVSPNGEYVATGTAEGELAIFRAKDLCWIFRKDVHGFFISRLAFSPDSSLLFSTSGDYSVVATKVESTRGILSQYGATLFWVVALLLLIIAVLLFRA
ncbi:60S ribosomal subunit assembly or modification protein [Balamuthia mandrillaris]